MDKKQNISYVFIPFCLSEPNQFRQTIDALEGHEDWEGIEINLRYMMKYITDKLDKKNREKCRCFCYELKESAGVKYGLSDWDAWYSVKGESRFHLQNMRLYCFGTDVFVMACRIEFEESDPLRIASALYQMKKASRTKIISEKTNEPITLLEVVRKMVDGIWDEVELQPFFYMEEDTARANTFTYLEVPEGRVFDQDLYYLKRCYDSDKFLYYEDEKQKEKEFFRTTADVMWGISAEAAVCLARPEMGRGEFIQSTLYKNMGEQYLFMYLLVLHQKYVLYLFLTRIGVGMYNEQKKLEEYKEKLHEFETDFVFSNISEVPQYQKLYEKMIEVHELHNMYVDVKEPLDTLSEIRRKKLKDEQQLRDEKVNRALFLLSILTVFSALTDSYQFAKDFLIQIVSEEIVSVIQWGLVFGIIGIVVYIAILLRRKE